MGLPGSTDNFSHLAGIGKTHCLAESIRQEKPCCACGNRSPTHHICWTQLLHPVRRVGPLRRGIVIFTQDNMISSGTSKRWVASQANNVTQRFLDWGDPLLEQFEHFTQTIQRLKCRRVLVKLPDSQLFLERVLHLNTPTIPHFAHFPSSGRTVLSLHFSN